MWNHPKIACTSGLGDTSTRPWDDCSRRQTRNRNSQNKCNQAETVLSKYIYICFTNTPNTSDVLVCPKIGCIPSSYGRIFWGPMPHFRTVSRIYGEGHQSYGTVFHHHFWYQWAHHVGFKTSPMKVFILRISPTSIFWASQQFYWSSTACDCHGWKLSMNWWSIPQFPTKLHDAVVYFFQKVPLRLASPHPHIPTSSIPPKSL